METLVSPKPKRLKLQINIDQDSFPGSGSTHHSISIRNTAAAECTNSICILCAKVITQHERIQFRKMLNFIERIYSDIFASRVDILCAVFIVKVNGFYLSRWRMFEITSIRMRRTQMITATFAWQSLWNERGHESKCWRFFSSSLHLYVHHDMWLCWFVWCIVRIGKIQYRFLFFFFFLHLNGIFGMASISR